MWQDIWHFFTELTNPESIVKLGLPLLLFVIFAETGLLVGFFLPGDSLVFISGLLCATNNSLLQVNFVELVLYMSLSAITGNMFGYWFGKRVGDGLYKRPDNFIFKKRRLEATHEFYRKHGGKTLILGRFLPIIRTFAPVLAGIIKIDFKQFMLYNISGALLWITGIGGIGYFLGSRFPFVKSYLGYIVIGLIVITSIPLLITYIRQRKKA